MIEEAKSVLILRVWKSGQLRRGVGRRGISEIIATLVMILLVLSVSTLIYAYTSNGLDGYGSSFSNLLSNQGQAISQQMSIEQATYNLTAGLPPYVVLTISNGQPSATPAPFQQALTINPSSYTNYEASDLGNIRFFSTLSGNSFSGPYDSWLESVSSNPPNIAGSATFWLNIPNGIAASSSIKVYMVFEPASTEFDGNIAGESPMLSSSFAKYDNGANIFLIYNNGASLFALSQTGSGGSGPSTTTTAPSPYTNAITGSVNGGSGNANTWTTDGETTNILPSSYIAQELVYLSGSAPLSDLLTNVNSISTGQFYIFRLDGRVGQSDLIGYYPSGGSATTVISTASTGSLTNTWYQLTAEDNNNQLSLYKSTTFALETPGALEVGPVTGQGYTGGGIGFTTDGASSTEYWTMIVVRAYPPGGAMPSVSIGSLVSGTQAGVDLYVRNTGTAAETIGAVYVQNVTANSFVLQYTISPQVTIQPGSFSKIAILFTPDAEDTYQFTVVTTLGTAQIATFPS